jgi:hypothetical protein
MSTNKMCACNDRPASDCPGEWEPGCDLGNNEKFAAPADVSTDKAGPYKIDEWGRLLDKGAETVLVCGVAIPFGYNRGGTDARDLLLDALNTRHATGKTPSELAAEVLNERSKRGKTEIVLGEWARAYHYVTDILPLDPRNLCRDPVCPMNLAEQDRHRVDCLIGERDALAAEVERLRSVRDAILYAAEHGAPIDLVKNISKAIDLAKETLVQPKAAP